MSNNVVIDANGITDWNSFHDLFAETFGFPDFYGRNMDAWNDCMTYLDDPEAGMTSIHVKPGEVVTLHISGIDELKKRLPEIYDAIVECSAFVNFRRIEKGQPAVLALAYYAS